MPVSSLAYVFTYLYFYFFAFRILLIKNLRIYFIFLEELKKNDGFIEKLLTQITKNIQIVIRNIHIRYEDKTTNSYIPFSIGITMSNLSATTSANDELASAKNEDKIGNENLNFICKAWTI